MVRTPLRVMVAAWTLVALMATAVSPAVMHAIAGSSCESDSHACCPAALGENAPAGHPTEAPMPCCAIGGTSQQAPVTNQIGSLTGASVPSGATDASWAQPVTLTAALLPRSTAPLGQIPPLLRTSLLRI